MATINRIDTILATGQNSNAINDGTCYAVEIPNGSLYIFYVDANSDPVFKKSTDYGASWGAATQLKACTCTQIAVWYDGWSGITATSYIHVVYTDTGTNDTFYRYVDTANSDTLGTERTVYAGSSAADAGTLSITRARGGNLICATCIDAGAEYDTVKSTDYFVNKTSIAEALEGATTDKIIMMPGWAADNQDVMAFFWDASANEVSVKFYDDSGDAWSETVLGTSMVEVAVYNPQFAAAVDTTNSQNVIVAWNGADAANADLRCWKVTEAAQTEVTNVVLNSTDDQACCAISIKGTEWHCFYMGASDGSESVYKRLKIYYKYSLDQGTTWGSETAASNMYYNPDNGFSLPTGVLYSNPVVYRKIYLTGYSFNVTINPYVNIPMPIGRRATFQLGM